MRKLQGGNKVQAWHFNSVVTCGAVVTTVCVERNQIVENPGCAQWIVHADGNRFENPGLVTTLESAAVQFGEKENSPVRSLGLRLAKDQAAGQQIFVLPSGYKQLAIVLAPGAKTASVFTYSR